MTTNLRKLNFTNELDISLLNENEIKFFNSSLLLRGKSQVTLLSYLNNVYKILDDRKKSCINYKPTEFGDINNKYLDPSVRFALFSVGLKLLEKKSLTPCELTYYFTKWRYNFLCSVEFDSLLSKQFIDQSQYTKILQKLEQYIPLFEVTNNGTMFEDISVSKNFSAGEINLYRTAKLQAEHYCYKYLNLLLLPVPSTSGKDSTLIFINDPNMTDREVFQHYYQFYYFKITEKQNTLNKMKVIRKGKKRNHSQSLLEDVATLTPETFQNLQNFLPSRYTFVTQYLLAVSCNCPIKLKNDYGISPIKKQMVMLRMAELMEKGLEIKERLSFDLENTEELRRQLRIKCENVKIFTNKLISIKLKQNCLKIQDNKLYLEIIDIIQQCARNLHGNSKSRGDTPIDSIILLKDDYQSELGSFIGGVVSRITSTVNATLKENNIDMTLSQSTIYNMFKDANIEFHKSPNNLTQFKIDQHYCSAMLKIIMQLAQIFSNEVSYCSVDAKSLIKVSTGGSLKGTTIQLMSEMKRVRCHDANVDTVGKISLYVIELLTQNPDLWEFAASQPEDGNYNKLGYINITDKMIPGWKKETHTKFTEGLGVAFAHNNDLHDETAGRNASDVCEMIQLYLPYFTAKDEKTLKSTYFFQMDNFKGPDKEESRFVSALIFLKYDLDALGVGCNAGGHSKYNPVEKCNGCLSTRLNQHSIEFENVEDHLHMSKEKRLENMEKAIQRVVDVADGTTCSHTGGHIDVRIGSHPPRYEGFQFHSTEISAFMKSKNKANFISEIQTDMTSAEVTEMYNIAWDIIHCTKGIYKTCHYTKHTLLIVKNFNIPNCLPLRGSKELHHLFKTFDRNFPMPIPSNKRKSTTGFTTSPSYSDLEELLQLPLLQRLMQSNNYYLPSLLFDKYLKEAANKTFFADYLSNNKELDPEIMEQLQLLLRASKKDIHIDINHRIVHNEKTVKELSLKNKQINTGVETEVLAYFKRVKKYGETTIMDNLVKFLREYKVNTRSLNRPILLQMTYQILIDNNLIDHVLPPIEIRDAAIILAGLQNAEERFEQVNHGIEDEDNNIN